MPVVGPRIAVLGRSAGDAELAALAFEVGRLLAGASCVLLTGGLDGVMEAVSRGAKENGGVTVGILPGHDAGQANRFVGLPLATGLGEARNAVLVSAAQAAIAIGQGYGTLSEIAFALRLSRPVVLLRSWQLGPPAITVASAQAAVQAVIAAAARPPS